MRCLGAEIGWSSTKAGGRRRGLTTSRGIRTEGRNYRDPDEGTVSRLVQGRFPVVGEGLDRSSCALCAGLPRSMAAGDNRIEQSSANHEQPAARDIQAVGLGCDPGARGTGRFVSLVLRSG